MKIIMMIVGLCLKVADVDETKRIRFAFRAMVAPLRIVEVGERQTATRCSAVFKKEVIKEKKDAGVAWRVVAWSHTALQLSSH